MQTFLVAGLSLLAICATATGANEKQIRELYRRGLAGDKAAVEACIAKLEEALRMVPRDQLARVYLGSAYTLRSRDLGFGPKKLRALKQGLALMDEAVNAAPAEPKVRLARALTTAALPGIFGRRPQSETDFEHLAAMAERTSTSFDSGDLQVIYYNAGQVAARKGDRQRARALWEKALRHNEDAALEQQIRAQLRS